MKKSFSSILFLLLLIAVAFVYNYHEIVFKRPQSTHKWRQSDCASLALNYYQNGMHFFQPKTHNLTSDGGTTGNACTSEIPILYYSVAVLYQLFGYNEALYRLLNTLLFFIGLFYLFKLFRFLLVDEFWAVALSLLFFTSPILIFYGNNFLSDTSALSFSIVGWYYFIRFYIEEKDKFFIYTNLFFLLAASFKVTALFSLFSLGGVFVFEILGLVRLRGNEKVFKSPFRQLLVMTGVVAVIGAWVLYARHYNQVHDCYYFSTTTFPVWSLDGSEILAVFENIKKIWLPQYFHFSVLIFLVVGFLFILRFYRKNLRVLNLALLFLIMEMILYVLLQFATFRDHDYYTINMYILVVIILLSFFYVLKIKYNVLFGSYLAKGLFAAFVLFNIYSGQTENNNRYNGRMNNFGQLSDRYTITPFLRELGIQPEDTIISIPDGSHVSLYLMNQKGWTEYTDARFHRGEPISYNCDSAGIQKSIHNGARYLLVDGIGELYNKKYLQHFCHCLKGRYNNILVFDLLGDSVNFSLNNREILSLTFCGAEHLDESKKHFLGTDSVVFKNGETQTADFAFHGNYSCKLAKTTPYGCTISFTDLKFGESFQLTAWRKKGGEGKIIASAKDYYNNEIEIVETRGDWELLKMEIFINLELENKELGIYLYNREDDPCYFDDFEIVRFRSVF